MTDTSAAKFDATLVAFDRMRDRRPVSRPGFLDRLLQRRRPPCDCPCHDDVNYLCERGCCYGRHLCASEWNR